MFGKSFGRKKKSDEKPAEADGGQDPAAPMAPLSRALSPSGRISLAALQKMAAGNDLDGFTAWVRKPVLAGAAIHAGTISSQSGNDSGAMNKTQLFEPDADGGSPASQALKNAVYPLVKGKQPATPKHNRFFVGRVGGNDLVMPDFAVSKQHAVVDVHSGSYYIRDLGSTNGTTVNGQPVGKKRVKLKDGDVIGFARYEFTFLLPASLYRMLRAGNS